MCLFVGLWVVVRVVFLCVGFVPLGGYFVVGGE